MILKNDNEILAGMKWRNGLANYGGYG